MTDVTDGKLSDITPDANNANLGTQRGLGMLESSLRKHGAGRSILLDREGRIIAGNKTVEQAGQIGLDDVIIVKTDGKQLVAVQREDLDLADDSTGARELAYADNRVGELDLSWNPETILADLDSVDLSELFRKDELSEILGELGKAPQEDPGAQVDKAAELQEKWGTSLGQIWELGEHRLAVGDCTDRAVVDAVMRGERAEMIWTDPPYGVSVGDKNKYLNSIAPSNRVEENLENDTLDESELTTMLCQAFDNAILFCLAGGAWYVAAPAGPLHVLFGQILKDRGIWRQTIQWVKNNATFSPLGVDYHWRAEPIFYGWLPGAAHRYYGGRTQDTVWEIDRPQKSPEHPTMKPVELVGRATENSSKQGEIIYDSFLGSGTTLIACEQLGRKCRGIEIDPGYVSVTLERWHTMTGKDPVLLNA